MLSRHIHTEKFRSQLHLGPLDFLIYESIPLDESFDEKHESLADDDSVHDTKKMEGDWGSWHADDSKSSVVATDSDFSLPGPSQDTSHLESLFETVPVHWQWEVAAVVLQRMPQLRDWWSLNYHDRWSVVGITEVRLHSVYGQALENFKNILRRLC